MASIVIWDNVNSGTMCDRAVLACLVFCSLLFPVATRRHQAVHAISWHIPCYSAWCQQVAQQLNSCLLSSSSSLPCHSVSKGPCLTPDIFAGSLLFAPCNEGTLQLTRHRAGIAAWMPVRGPLLLGRCMS